MNWLSRQKLDKMHLPKEQLDWIGWHARMLRHSYSFCHTSFSVLTRVLWQSIDSWTGSHIVEQTTATFLGKKRIGRFRHHPCLSEIPQPNEWHINTRHELLFVVIALVCGHCSITLHAFIILGNYSSKFLLKSFFYVAKILNDMKLAIDDSIYHFWCVHVLRCILRAIQLTKLFMLTVNLLVSFTSSMKISLCWHVMIAPKWNASTNDIFCVHCTPMHSWFMKSIYEAIYVSWPRLFENQF